MVLISVFYFFYPDAILLKKPNSREQNVLEVTVGTEKNQLNYFF